MAFKVGDHCLIDFHNDGPHLGRKVAVIEQIYIDGIYTVKTVNFDVKSNLFNVWHHVVDKESLKEASTRYPYIVAYDFFITHCDEEDLLCSRPDTAKYLRNKYPNNFENVILALASAAYEINSETEEFDKKMEEKIKVVTNFFDKRA